MGNEIVSRVASHSAYCAARNWKTALVALLFSSFEVWLCWRDLAHPLPEYHMPIDLLLGCGVALVMLADLSLTLQCWRERLVIALWSCSFLKTIAVVLIPSPLASHFRMVRAFSLIVWATAALISLSLMKSALGVSAATAESK